MDKIVSFLTEWAETYVKNMDLMLRKIEEIKKEGNHIFVKYKDKAVLFIAVPFLNDSVFEAVKECDYVSLVVFNTDENIDFVASNWHKLNGLRGLTVYFVNPFSSTEKKWVLHPYTHHKISDDASLKRGLKSLSDSVETLTEEKIIKIHRKLHQHLKVLV